MDKKVVSIAGLFFLFLLLTVGGSWYVGYLGARLPVGSPKDPVIRESDEFGAEILTNRVLVRLTRPQAEAVLKALEPQRMSEAGEPRVAAAKAAIPQLEAVDNIMTNITPVAEQEPRFPETAPLQMRAEGEASAVFDVEDPVNRWFELIFAGEQVPVKVKNLDSFTRQPRFDILSTEDGSFNENLEQTKDIVRQLALAGFEHVEPVQVFTPLSVPNDPFYHSSGSWGQSYSDLWGLKTIEAEGAWAVTTGSRDVVIAVIDTGVDINHPDLADNIWVNPNESLNGQDDSGNGLIDDIHGWNFVQNNNDVGEPACGGHGTHVAGTIAAVGNNGIGITGVMWEAQIMSVPFFQFGTSCQGLANEGAAAIKYAADNGAHIINKSWGGYTHSQVIADAIEYAYGKGVLSVGASGNLGLEGIVFPANLPEVMAVGATAPDDTRVFFSNWGQELEVVAPGGGIDAASNPNILSLFSSTADPAFQDFAVGDGYLRLAGTSMAAPHVSGLAGLLMAKNPDWTADEIRQTIKFTADNLGGSGFNPQTGYGRINAKSALSVDIPNPVANISSPASSSMAVLNNGNVEITGSAYSRDFSHFEIEISKATEPFDWSSSDVSLTDGGQISVDNGVLGVWEIGGNFSPGEYAIKLEAVSTSGQNSIAISDNIYVDNTVRDGWPIDFGSGDGLLIGPRIGAGNITGGSEKEIVVVRADDQSNTKIDILKHDGTHIVGSPLELDSRHAMGAPLLKDLTGDGLDEIIVVFFNEGFNDPAEIVILRGNGEILPGWPRKIDFPFIPGSMPVVVDLNNDGSLNIVLAAMNWNDPVIEMHAYNISGQSLPGWPKQHQLAGDVSLNVGVENPLAAIDANNDGNIELFFRFDSIKSFTDVFSYIMAMNNNGEILPGWPFVIPEWTSDGISVGDITGDGMAEVIAVTEGGIGQNDEAKIYALNLGGELLNSWPVGLYKNVIFNGMPTLHDLNGDGSKEIIIDRNAFYDNGNRVPGWDPLLSNPDPETDDGTAVFESAIISDVSGDGLGEVIFRQAVTYQSGFISRPLLHAYTPAGNDAESGNWPRLLRMDSQLSTMSLISADIDSNGLVEIIAMVPSSHGYQIVAYNTPGKSSAGTWPLIHGDAQNSRTLAGASGGENEIIITTDRDAFNARIGETLTFTVKATESRGLNLNLSIPNLFQLFPGASFE